ncbi:2-phospho-L-lactate guanylyltransferase [Saccharomonospora piscinae]|uniref:2-phospho-L-lactate guanylyltransferase n=1 Tax=Saccharomonospora piscinae TaxID=687388 RepID=UPI0011058055|nr:2-phospho-L-lactate guanylyltransferase [Saccharomonospora piscinae]TLW90852.1 2-phospho-L-lactate guanylyltransferase [Saccharomonospora piscinae]
MAVDLIVPLKEPNRGKSRLRGALGTAASEHCHAGLVLALAADTLGAAVAAPGVRRVLVVGTDPVALAALRGLGVEVVGERATGDHRTDPADPADRTAAPGSPDDGLNAALRTGERILRADDPDGVVGALQADLPALRPGELGAALAEAAGRRAFAADRDGSGTTLLLSAPGLRLTPRFGAGSAQAHARSGAVALAGPLPSLRADVDTAGDLDHARLLGLGEHTLEVLDRACLLS